MLDWQDIAPQVKDHHHASETGDTDVGTLRVLNNPWLTVEANGWGARLGLLLVAPGPTVQAEHRVRMKAAGSESRSTRSTLIYERGPLQQLTIMQARCQCNTIRFTTPINTPLALYHCHCTQCRLQSGSAFGTSAIFPYFSLREVLASSALPHLRCWTRSADSGALVECYFCSNCGTRLVHVRWPEGKGEGKEPAGMVSVKGGCIEGLGWDGGKHIWCSKAVVPIPPGAERWEGEPDE